jgi:hypothetical protein
LAEARRDPWGDLTGSEVDPVDRPDRLDASHRAGEEDLAGAEQVVAGQAFLVRLDSSGASDRDRLLASDAGKDPPVGRWGREVAVANREEISPRGLEHGAVAVEQQRHVPGWDVGFGAFQKDTIGPLVGSEPTLRHNAVEGDTASPGREYQGGIDLGRRDPCRKSPIVRGHS